MDDLGSGVNDQVVNAVIFYCIIIGVIATFYWAMLGNLSWCWTLKIFIQICS
jgi:hypothetical protein